MASICIDPESVHSDEIKRIVSAAGWSLTSIPSVTAAETYYVVDAVSEVLKHRTTTWLHSLIGASVSCQSFLTSYRALHRPNVPLLPSCLFIEAVIAADASASEVADTLRRSIARFRRALSSTRVCCTGIKHELKSAIELACTILGAPFERDYTPKVTHLITALTTSPKYVAALSIPNTNCVRVQWLWACFNTASLVPAAQFPVWLFEGNKICVTGIQPDERELLGRMITASGGQYAANFTKDCTHLLAESASGDKYKAALNWRVAVCSKYWVYMCVQSRTLLDASKYPIGIPDPRPPPDVAAALQLDAKTKFVPPTTHVPSLIGDDAVSTNTSTAVAAPQAVSTTARATAPAPTATAPPPVSKPQPSLVPPAAPSASASASAGASVDNENTAVQDAGEPAPVATAAPVDGKPPAAKRGSSASSTSTVAVAPAVNARAPAPVPVPVPVAPVRDAAPVPSRLAPMTDVATEHNSANDSFLDRCRIVLVGFDGPTTTRGETIIRNGGGTRFVSYRANATHIVVPSWEMLRTAVLAPNGIEISDLTNSGSGCAIVNFDWLVDSHRNTRIASSNGYQPAGSGGVNGLQSELPSAAALATAAGGVNFADFYNQTALVPAAVPPQKLQTRSNSNTKALAAAKVIVSTASASAVDRTLLAPEPASAAPAAVMPAAGAMSGGVFAGHTFTCFGMSLKDKLPLVKFIKAAGGVMVDPPSGRSAAASGRSSASAAVSAVEYVVLQVRTEAAMNLFPHSQFVNQLWVAICLRESQLLPTIQTRPYRHELLLYAPPPEIAEIPALSGLCLSSTGFTADERTELCTLLDAVGAKYTEAFAHANTHLLCKPTVSAFASGAITSSPAGAPILSADDANSRGTVSGPKFEKSFSWNKPAVSLGWLWACIEQKKIVTEVEPYTFPPPQRYVLTPKAPARAVTPVGPAAPMTDAAPAGFDITITAPASTTAGATAAVSVPADGLRPPPAIVRNGIHLAAPSPAANMNAVPASSPGEELGRMFSHTLSHAVAQSTAQLQQQQKQAEPQPALVSPVLVSRPPQPPAADAASAVDSGSIDSADVLPAVDNDDAESAGGKRKASKRKSASKSKSKAKGKSADAATPKSRGRLQTSAVAGSDSASASQAAENEPKPAPAAVPAAPAAVALAAAASTSVAKTSAAPVSRAQLQAQDAALLLAQSRNTTGTADESLPDAHAGGGGSSMDDDASSIVDPGIHLVAPNLAGSASSEVPGTEQQHREAATAAAAAAATAKRAAAAVASTAAAVAVAAAAAAMSKPAIVEAAVHSGKRKHQPTPLNATVPDAVPTPDTVPQAANTNAAVTAANAVSVRKNLASEMDEAATAASAAAEQPNTKKAKFNSITPAAGPPSIAVEASTRLPARPLAPVPAVGPAATAAAAPSTVTASATKLRTSRKRKPTAKPAAAAAAATTANPFDINAPHSDPYAADGETPLPPVTVLATAPVAAAAAASDVKQPRVPPRFMLSGFEEKQRVDIESKLTALGASILTDREIKAAKKADSARAAPLSGRPVPSVYDTVTHIVCNDLKRTEKTLVGLAGQKWLLRAGYVTASAEAGKFVSESEHSWSERTAAPAERNDEKLRSMLQAIDRWRPSASGAATAGGKTGRPFESYRVWLHSTVARELLMYFLLSSGGAPTLHLLPAKQPEAADAVRARANYLSAVLQPAQTSPDRITHAFIDRQTFDALYQPAPAPAASPDRLLLRSIVDWLVRSDIPILDDQYIIAHIFRTPTAKSLIEEHRLKPPLTTTTAVASSASAATAATSTATSVKSKSATAKRKH